MKYGNIVEYLVEKIKANKFEILDEIWFKNIKINNEYIGVSYNLRKGDIITYKENRWIYE